MYIVREQGAARLTLDEAARQAGVSKGGVLYHFRSKDDLIRAMVQRLIEEYDEQAAAMYAREAEGPYRWARTYVGLSFDPRGPGADPVGAAVLAAVALNPDLLAPIRAMFHDILERLRSDSPDPTRALLIGLALDGLFLNRVTGLHLYDDATMENLRQTAMALLA
ncbi:TetR family transcriptional regulator [Pararhodospirillum oryzae]|uniref:TetR family transcriptional regulator n=2 Tax=Pararhodospirillum oryzae TaxID=478448 RepID=A0A512H5M0_9PROT|nr:TetR family transcriptional regulator [Pararhodospirillum oryzae]